MPYIRPHIHSLFFGGKDLRDFGVHVSGDGSFNAPERDYETVEVPGRSGDLLFDLGRFKNIEVTYHGFIGNDLESNLRSLRSFLLSQKGYKRLEDTYHPDEFRLATFVSGIDPTIIMLQAGEFDLSFNCKPQRFLKSGENKLQYSQTDISFSIGNPTHQIAKPLIRVYGDGVFSIASDETSYIVTISEHENIPYIDIDCDICDCYYDATNCNSYVTFSNNEFPTLVSGENSLRLENGIAQVQITPRWWEL